MEAIKKITKVKNGSISFKKLEQLNNQEVEVIVLPLVNQELSKRRDQKERLFQFAGKVESQFSDTSTNVDRLIYGK